MAKTATVAETISLWLEWIVTTAYNKNVWFPLIHILYQNIDCSKGSWTDGKSVCSCWFWAHLRTSRAAETLWSKVFSAASFLLSKYTWSSWAHVIAPVLCTGEGSRALGAGAASTIPSRKVSPNVLSSVVSPWRAPSELTFCQVHFGR
jgi:hypothetical protein